jgi:hypothetical protein
MLCSETRTVPFSQRFGNTAPMALLRDLLETGKGYAMAGIDPTPDLPQRARAERQYVRSIFCEQAIVINLSV